ncbi:hypothetical protein [Geopseudomonas aromaticivorans]
MMRRREPEVRDEDIDAEVGPAEAPAPAQASTPAISVAPPAAQAAAGPAAYGVQHDVEFAVYGGIAPGLSPSAKTTKPKEPEKPVDVVKEQGDALAALRKREALEKRNWEAFFLSATSIYLKDPANGGICRKAEADGGLVRFLLGPEDKALGEIVYDRFKNNISIKGNKKGLDDIQSAMALIEMGQALGWTMMTFEGSKEFVQAASSLAQKAGIEVVNRQTLDARLALKREHGITQAPPQPVKADAERQPPARSPKPMFPTRASTQAPSNPGVGQSTPTRSSKPLPPKPTPVEPEDDYGFSPSPV